MGMTRWGFYYYYYYVNSFIYMESLKFVFLSLMSQEIRLRISKGHRWHLLDLHLHT